MILRALLGIEFACLIVVGFHSYNTLVWEGPENWAAVALFIYGGAAVLLLLLCMLIALVVIRRSDFDRSGQNKRYILAILPFAISILMIGICYANEFFSA